MARMQTKFTFSATIALREIHISTSDRKSVILILPLVVTPRIAITKKFISISITASLLVLSAA
jgi:hypothetical protein